MATLRTRLLRLGAEISAALLVETLSLPVPSQRFWEEGGRFQKGGFCYVDESIDLCSSAGDLSEQEKERCDTWLGDGLACFDTSLLSAFNYLPKDPEETPWHCEEHRDRGLLTLVLQPAGLEVLNTRTGEWVRADRARTARRLARAMQWSCLDSRWRQPQAAI
jgi:hypothetical protein